MTQTYRGGRVQTPEQQPAPPRILERQDSGRDTMRRLRQAREQNPGCEPIHWALALELKDREDPHSVTPGVRATYREAIDRFRKFGREDAA